MSKKALFLLENPPSASSTEDDEISSEEDSDRDQPMQPEPSQEHRSVKAPIAATLSKKRQREGTSSTPVTPKRAKTTSQKSAGTSRAWSEEADEISLLQHLINFHADTGISPFIDKHGFYEFVKESISSTVKKSQVDDKIRGIKKKYIVNRNYRLGQAHDEECLRLVKCIWRDDGTPLLTSKNVVQEEKNEVLPHTSSDGKGEGLGHGGGGLGDKVVQGEMQGLAPGDSDWFENSVLVKSFTLYGVEEQTVKERWSSFSPVTKKEIEHNWTSFESKKLDVVSQMIEYASDLASQFARS